MGRLVLKRDVTNIHPELKVGVEGEFKYMSRGSDALWNVYFPSIKKTFELYSSNFETIYSEEEIREHYEEFIDTLRNATEITYSHGPRGGNKRLSYSYYDSKNVGYSTSTGDKKKVTWALDFLIKNNIPFEEETLPTKK